MSWIREWLWLIPLAPLAAAGLLALTPRAGRRRAAWLGIGSLSVATVLSWAAFFGAWPGAGGAGREVNFTWLTFGRTPLELGWVLDPLTGAMLAMVSTVALLIFVYSLGDMRADPNFTRFFCFLSFFAGSMLGLVMANSLLWLFMCWELVGLASYLLIGFWFEKPAAAAAAKKAFLVTRIGDLGLLL
ncbi:MAG TPA: proton-conducting transporter membrane subunit, partial [Candidatus Paceibacterota bacterium]|nr:proton-conducting transporter membrane subunit [Candidatus Paceibacterota bacterium]